MKQSKKNPTHEETLTLHEKGLFTHTLPNGKRVEDVNAQDLFDQFRDDLSHIKQQLRDMMEDIDRCLIHDIDRYKRLAAKRGGIEVIWKAGKCVDVIQGRERKQVN